MRRLLLLTLAALAACGDNTPTVDEQVCGTAQTICGDGADFYCADLASSEDDCGACGTACAVGEQCIEGGCVAACADGLEVCGDVCIDLESDAENCGACGDACAIGEACVAGACSCGFVALDASRVQTCGVKDDGSVVCSGSFNSSCWASQTADGGNGCNVAPDGPMIPATIPELGEVALLDLGDSRGCALPGDGSVWCIGSNYHGALGDGTGLPSAVAVQVRTATDPVAFLDGVTAVVVGGDHACAIRNATELWCWGDNSRGQLGTGATSADSLVAVKATLPEGLVPTQLALGWDHTCALDDGGTVWCWGSNNWMQSGAASGNDVLTPTEIPGLTGVVDVASDTDFTCAATSDGTVWCWGRNNHSQLGLPAANQGSTAVQMMADAVTPLTGVEDVAVGSAFACTRKQDDTIWCWGRNKFGQLGNGMIDPIDNSEYSVAGSPSRYPVQVLIADGEPLVGTSLAASHAHACAIVGPERHPYCWGSNKKGQAGLDVGHSAYARPIWGCGQ
jgi:alpha-tubulin suppressor-like RCC1 family protein